MGGRLRDGLINGAMVENDVHERKVPYCVHEVSMRTSCWLSVKVKVKREALVRSQIQYPCTLRRYGVILNRQGYFHTAITGST